MEEEKTVRIRGLFPTLLTVLLIGLQMTGEIDWHWIWVASPMWISVILRAFIDAVRERLK